MILGDSFAEGLPFNNSDDIAGKINFKSNYNTANYGVMGTGPFMSLAVTKEYASRLKPKNVFYLFWTRCVRKTPYLIDFFNSLRP